MTEKSVETVDITLIDLNWDIYPRERVDEEVVQSYQISMEDGAVFPPLVVQRDTYTLIDGFHRFYASKNLGREKVDVEVIAIPDSELRAETVRRNIKHGNRLTEKELRRMIIALRFQDKMSLKQIANIVKRSVGRISQICEEYQIAPRYFINFNPKISKVDLRRKVDPDKVLEDLKVGLSGKEIAKKYDISQSTVSRIKTENEIWAKSPVYIKVEPHRARTMFKMAFIYNLLKKARFEFKDEGVLIRNSDNENQQIIVAIFPKTFFTQYRVNTPIEGYAESDILRQFQEIKEDYVELALLDKRTWKIRYGGKRKQNIYEDIDWREFPAFPLPNLELDEDGIPVTAHVKAQTLPEYFPRKEKGKLTLNINDGELSCSFTCRHGWECNQILKIETLEKTIDAQAYVDLETLDKILKLFKTPVWIGMWSDQTSLAIGYGCLDFKMCFII